ncbi:hypothetical protein ACS0TY_021871 [Phlomoides rotata]
MMRTSCTTENPGRRFRTCIKNGRRDGCDFWDWEDPPMCSRSKMIIPGLLRRISSTEVELLKFKASMKHEKYKLFVLAILLSIFISWVAFSCKKNVVTV